MAIVDAATSPAQEVRADWRPWLACGLAVLSAMSYVVTMVLPYYAAGLPSRDSLYLYEADAQWPYTSAAGPLVHLLSLWALAIAPVLSLAVAGWSACRLWITRSQPAARSVLWTAMLVSCATFGWFTTPLSADLVGWMLD